MKQVLTRLDKIVIFCKNVERTSSLYSQALGLKVYLQSETFVELKDSNNFSIYLQAYTQPSQLMKGYSPMLSFRVQDIDKTVEKLSKYDIIFDGEPQVSQFGKVFTFLGMDNQMITVNNFEVMEEENRLSQNENNKNQQDDLETAQIKKLLQKIKM